jgi:23S rRNA (cytidine1920-2'-O)/16S rRNA (cytidine1409-2'-O)-methyltransferase
MHKQRLDQYLFLKQLVSTRSQAETYIKLGEVKVNGSVILKSGFMVDESAHIEVTIPRQYVSRAALKLASVAKLLGIVFTGKTVLDVGSSTGGFTQYALEQGASKVIDIEVGTGQLHPSLRDEPKIELHEKTDIRDVKLDVKKQPTNGNEENTVYLSAPPDIVVADVSFISLREILPHIASLCSVQTQIVVMLKPQFETAQIAYKHKGVIKNDTMRRTILKDFEHWAEQAFLVLQKADSEVAGAKGNRERFYLLRKLD